MSNTTNLTGKVSGVTQPFRPPFQQQRPFTLVREILSRILPFWPYWTLGTLLALLQSGYNVGIAAMEGHVLDLIGAARLEAVFRALLVWGIALIGIYAASQLGWLLVNYGSVLVTYAFRREVLDHVNRSVLAEIDQWPSGDLVSRIHGDTAQAIQDMMRDLATAASTLLTMVLAFVYLARVHLSLSVVVAVSGPLFFLLGRTVDSLIRSRSEAVRKSEGALRSFLQEDLQNMEVVRAYNLEEWVMKRFSSLRRENKQLALQLAIANNLLWLTNNISYVLFSILVTAAVAWAAIHGDITAGAVLAFSILINRVTGSFAYLSNIWGGVQQALGAARRVVELLHLPVEPIVAAEAAQSHSQPHRDSSVTVQDGEPLLELKNVTFGYPARPPVFKDLSLALWPGEVVGLVGASGAGKSTLAKLVAGLYLPQVGVVRVCGHDTTTELEKVRQLVGYASQRPYLFSDTVLTNVTCGMAAELTDEQMTMTGLTLLTPELEQGVQTPVGEQGGQLSGGQRQRVALARVLLRRPRLLVLDEATSSLDNEIEAAVWQVIERYRSIIPGVGILVIAHRLTTVTRADRILVMDGGQIVEQGTHAELLARGGAYARLWQAGIEQ